MELPYEQLQAKDVRDMVIDHIRNRERQHAELLCNITINEACREASKKAGHTKAAAQYAAAIAQQRAEAEALLRGVQTLKAQYADVLGTEDGAEPFNVPPVK